MEISSRAPAFGLPEPASKARSRAEHTRNPTSEIPFLLSSRANYIAQRLTGREPVDVGGDIAEAQRDYTLGPAGAMRCEDHVLQLVELEA